MAFFPTVTTFKMGAWTFTNQDMASAIHLFGGATTGGRYCTLRTSNATSGYTVTAGKTLTIKAFLNFSNGAGVATGVKFGYGDTDVGTNDAAAAPTNVVWDQGPTSLNSFYGVGWSGANAYDGHAHFFQVPAGKFPCVRFDNTNGTVYAIGFEA